MPKAVFICVLTILAALGAGAADAAQSRPSERSKGVSLNPFGLVGTFGGLLDVQYEFRRTKQQSIALRADFGGQSWGAYNSFSAFGVGGMWRMWPNKSALNEWYWGPAASLNFLTITIKDPWLMTSGSSNGVALGVGIEGGYQYIAPRGGPLPEGLLLDGGLGLRLVFGSLKAKVGNYSVTAPLSGFGFFLRGGIGYAWK